MFFNIELRQRNMSPDDLMSVRPEVLARLILHKRERLVEKLPKLIAELGEQKQISENLARRSRANKEDLDVKVLNLKMERKTVLQELSQQKSKKLKFSKSKSVSPKMSARSGLVGKNPPGPN